MFAFIFHCHSFSPCWPLPICWPLAFLIFSPPLWNFMFFFQWNSSPLISITRSSSFSVIHVSGEIKNNVEKDTTLLLLFSLSGHVICFQIKAWVAFGLSYLFIELFYIDVPVVWMDGPGYGRVIAKISWMGRLPHFLTYGTQLPEGDSSAISQWGEKTKRVSRLRSRSWPASILHGETTGSVRDHLLHLVLGCSGPQDNLTVLRWAPTYKNQKERIAGILKTSMKPCSTAVRSQWGMLSMHGVQAKLLLREK